MTTAKVNLEEKFARLPGDDYAMGIVAKMNDYEIKIVKFKGDFVWHSHPDTDETFIILDGVMRMHFRDGSTDISRGEMIVIPRGVEHKPSSVEGYRALLIEPEGVPNTGGIDSDLAKRPRWV